jgi:hypothetical protein
MACEFPLKTVRAMAELFLKAEDYRLMIEGTLGVDKQVLQRVGNKIVNQIGWILLGVSK